MWPVEDFHNLIVASLQILEYEEGDRVPRRPSSRCHGALVAIGVLSDCSFLEHDFLNISAAFTQPARLFNLHPSLLSDR
jgi:hypothetical protein